MSARFSPLKWLAIVTVFIGLAFTAAPGYADSDQPADNSESTCLSCHQNLYYLYDTGKWFCLCAAPMECATCHGGNPTAADMATAHQNRKAHPIIGDDTTTCQQCHLDNCANRVQKFDQVAGISQNIQVAVSTQPRVTTVQPIAPQPTAEIDPVVLIWSLGGAAVLVAAVIGLWLLRRARSANSGR